jgi:hypothetical protein
MMSMAESKPSNVFQSGMSRPNTAAQNIGSTPLFGNLLRLNEATGNVRKRESEATIGQQHANEEIKCFSPEMRRDIYNLIRNPTALNEEYEGEGVALVGQNTQQAFVFIDKTDLKKSPLPLGWEVLDDRLTIEAIDHIGDFTPLSSAVLRAFEKYLETKAQQWTGADVENLSVQFLICFGKELTPRLDINHRCRTRLLTTEEAGVLSTAPYNQFVDGNVMQLYQGKIYS